MNTLNIQYQYYVETRKDFPKLSLFASWPGALINPLWLELPIFQTNIHCPKYVGAIGVRLCYICWLYFTKVTRLLSESATALQSTLLVSNSKTIDTFIWDESCFIKIEQKSHYENTPIQIYRKFHLLKTENFRTKNFDIFYISAQNIDCGYSLEPPRRGGSNEYRQSIFLSRN